MTRIISKGRVLVCGGRTFNDWKTISRTLEVANPTMILHGNANGADMLAGVWAREKGLPYFVCPANWDYYHRSAGNIRNGWMIDFIPIDTVIAFPGGKGTADMVAKAKAKNIPVWEITVDEVEG